MLSIQNKAPVLYQVSELICLTGKINQQALLQARRVVADTVGVAYSGVETETFRRALKTINSAFGPGEYKIWGTEIKTTLFGAVFFNTLSVSSTDFDEGHRKAVGHPASLVVPAALILGRHLKRTTIEILHAIVIGYEIGSRFSNARFPEKIETYSSGRWGALGTAAACAHLLKLSEVETMHALSLASVLSPAMLGGSIDVSTGSMAKEGVPWAAETGMQSTFLAASGFIGPFSFVDDTYTYDKDKLIDGLGKEWFINSNYFKPYSCCRWLHTAIREAIELREEFNLIPEKISKIDVEVFVRAIKLVASKYPENPVQAQFHLPYVIACALIWGKVVPEHFSSSKLSDPGIIELIDKISLIERKDYTDHFPDSLLSKVHIDYADEVEFSREIDGAPWDASNPPTDEELKQKFLLQTQNKGELIWDLIMEGDVNLL